MAIYTTTIRTQRPADDVFAYMSDLLNFAEWDPGTKGVVQVGGSGPGPDARYDVTVSAPIRDMVLTYAVMQFDPPRAVTARAESKSLISKDVITITADGDATLVTYSADLQLKGLLRVADIGLSLVFKRIGDKAAAGLAKHLDGVIVTEPDTPRSQV